MTLVKELLVGLSRTPRRGWRALFISMALVVVTPLLGVGDAHAAASWSLQVTVYRDGGALAEITDTLSPGLDYPMVMTAAGGGTCGGAVVAHVADVGRQLLWPYPSVSTAGAGCSLI